MGYRARRRRESRWWISQLALLLAACAVIAAATAYTKLHDGSRDAVNTHDVLGASKTVTHTRAAAKPAVRHAAVGTRRAKPAVQKAHGPLLAKRGGPISGYLGKYVRASAVRVTGVVGPSIFWVAGSSGVPYLVHMQRGDAAWRIHTGQRLRLVASVTRSHTGALRAWGLTPAEGLARAARQGYHLEVVGPRVGFPCVARCYGRVVRP